MKRLTRTVLAVVSLAGTADIARASVQSAWPLLGFARDESCELDLVGNGKFFELRGRGFVPGEALSFTLGNGTMKPITWQVFATRNGTWTKLYIPFRFGEPGGMISVWLDSSRCSLVASGPWRRTVRVIG